jgi:predicted N-acetyltransferase YhbS
MSESITVRPETAADIPAVEALQRRAFGPGAYARAAFRVREQAPHDARLSFVALSGDDLIASVRMTPIAIGENRGLQLGPLVVDPAFAGRGHGKGLVRHALAAARDRQAPFVLLVGDESYYGPLGFKPLVPAGGVTMPGPADPARILVAELLEGAAQDLRGQVRGVATEFNPQPQGGFPAARAG